MWTAKHLAQASCIELTLKRGETAPNLIQTWQSLMYVWLFIDWHQFIPAVKYLFGKTFQISKIILTYRKVGSSRLSRLVAHFHNFRLFMKGNFDAYVLWPVAKRVQNWIVDRSTARDFTVIDLHRLVNW